MSREIKFRAFDVDQGIMFNPLHISFSRDNPECYRVTDCKSDGGEWLIGCCLMQFTGLKDKNGREIYEGDIIEYSSRDDCGGLDIWRGSVEFTDCAFQVKLVDGCNFNGSYEFLCDWSECEVIGNIYENPELLESK